MSARGNRLQAFWQEFVRRRVVRVAIFYGAGAWLLLQVADVALEAFEAEFALKYVMAAVVAGFPAAVVLSWMFDITPRGIVRTPPVEAFEAPPRSLAVLPFSNLSDDPGNEYFSDGLAEEIRDQLARIDGLRVAARTSSFAFKGRHEDAREIGRKLDVGLILEGGVRKYGDRLRISAQLVDANRGYQIWSETFERRVEDVFQLQSEISLAILDAVHVRVMDGTERARRTVDFDAWNLYLHGRFHFHKRSESSLQRSVDYFRRAIERDPGYALAYSGLADAMCLLSTGFYGNLSQEASIAEALPAAERALALAPDSPEASASIGLIRYTQLDFDGAIASLEHAIDLDRSYSLAHVWLGLVLLSTGRFREAEERNLEALKIDPLSPIANANAGFDAIRFGRDKDAEGYFSNVIELDPTFTVAYSGMARLREERGALDEALRWHNKAIERAPSRSYYLARKGFVYLQTGQTELASEWLEAARQNSPRNQYLADALLGLAILQDDRDRLEAIGAGDAGFGESQHAFASLVTGEEPRALALYRAHCPSHESLLRDLVNDEWLWRIPHVVYKNLLAQKDGDDAARAELESMLEALEATWSEGIVNANTRYWAADALAVLGRTDEAIGMIGEALELGWRNAWWARRDPALDALRDDPRFGTVLADADRRVNAVAGLP